MSLRVLLWTGVLVTTLAVVAPRPLHATQIEHRALPALASDAELVVEGRVVAQRSFWNSARTRILTETEVAVDRAHKGRGPSTVTVVQMGGVVDGMRMTVQGAVSWRLDEEVLLFLEPSLPGRHRLAGFSQGKFRIEVDPATGERVAVRPALGGVELLGADAADTSLRLPVERLLERAQLRVDGGR